MQCILSRLGVDMQFAKTPLLSASIDTPYQAPWTIIGLSTIVTGLSLWIGLRATSLVWSTQTVIVFPELDGLSLPRLAMMAIYGILGLIYCRWLVRPTIEADRIWPLIRQAAPFGLLALLAFPSSTDVFLYLQYGQMAWQGVNPYLVSVESVASPLSLFLHWPGCSPYGPVSQFLFMAAAWAVSWGVLPALFLFKSFCLGIHGLNGYLIWRSGPAGHRRSKLTLAYLLNPMLLSEFVVNAHNEVLLTTAVIVMILALYRRQYTIALLAIGMGALIKTLPIIWLPIVCLYLVRRGHWRPMAIALGLGLGLGGWLSQTWLPTAAAWRNLIDPAAQHITFRSLHHVVHLLTATWPMDQGAIAIQIVTGLTLGLVAVVGFAIGARVLYRRDYDEIMLVQDLIWLTLALLMAKPYLAPWHTTTLMVMGALTVQAPRLWASMGIIGLSPLLLYGTGGGSNWIGLASTVLFLAIVLLSLYLPPTYGKRWGRFLQL
jgi:alpha-1,6-mannosyltransferase